jgi:hypothetical protein
MSKKLKKPFKAEQNNIPFRDATENNLPLVYVYINLAVEFNM